MIGIIIAIMLGWEKVFKQKRVLGRAMRQALSMVSVLGRRTIARSYQAREERGDWSSEYKLHSRSKWEGEELFEPILRESLGEIEGTIIGMGCDDTRIKKSGKGVKNAQWGRDPMSPPFRVNLQYGLRYLHTSILLPLHKKYGVSARAIPVGFEEAPPLKKPGKKATPEQKQNYKEAIKKHNLSVQALAIGV